LAVPVKVAGRVIAVLNAESSQPGAFGEEDLSLFSAIAAQLGVVLENTRLFEETNRRLAETRLLQEVMQAAASTLDFDEVLTRTIETLHGTLGVDYLTFVLPDERGTDLVAHPSWIGYSTPSETRIPIDGSVCGQVYQSGEPQIIPDVLKATNYFETVPGVRSELAVPVKVADQVVAVLDAESARVGAFDEDDLRLLSAVAAQLGVVLQNARLFEETSRHLADAELVQEVMLAAASTLDFDLVLERTAKSLNRALGIGRLGFLLVDEGDGTQAPQIPEGTLVEQAYRTGQPVLVQDLAQRTAHSEYAPQVRSALAVPVRVGSRIAAVLHAESVQVGAFSGDDLRLFTTIAGQLGMTLENARLYQQLEAQASELSRAYSELQTIDRLRAQLVQNVSHELRTPLGLIKGYVELLAAGDLGRVLDSQQAALQVIRERIATLARLINNLTLLQAMPREALVLSPVSVVEVVRHALAEFRRSAEEAGILLQEDLPEGLPLIIGDQDRLELIFGHLVDNAIKFSPNGGRVTLRAWLDQDQKRVCVSIADMGIGISPKHLSRIFERFYQVDGSTRRRFGGMGVGLALVWEIVEAHGGTVDVESESEKGSVFTVALPQAEGDVSRESGGLSIQSA
jgi:signal transduction histidine kinase